MHTLDAKQDREFSEILYTHPIIKCRKKEDIGTAANLKAANNSKAIAINIYTKRKQFLFSCLKELTPFKG